MRIALSFLLLACACKAAAPASSLLVPDGRGMATASGPVLENIHACTRDGYCMLRLPPAQDGGELLVVYHYGEGERRCTDADLLRRALALEPGSKVLVRGRYTRSGSLHEVDICTAPGAFLRRNR